MVRIIARRHDNRANWLSGFDDVIYPVDYKVAGHIVDDEMHDIMYVAPTLVGWSS